MDILGLPKYDWPPILVIAKNCHGTLHPCEPENVDHIGREVEIGSISDYIGTMSNLLIFIVVESLRSCLIVRLCACAQ